MLQFHITFTLASVTLCSHVVAFIGQQEPLTLLHYVFFFAQILLTCDPRGLGRRPFFAPGDTRPASTMPGDDYSKQFRRELLNYHHLEVNIKMLNEVNFFCLFLNESQTCMPWKA